MKIKYIPDKEINLDENDLLGAKPYVDTLSEIISQSKTPFTIGLFGGWGVGKSSIIKTIEDKFNNDPKSDVAVFTYDAWKYSKDSFRRTFLFELKEFFKLDISDSFKSFYEDRSEDIDHKLAVNKYSFGWWLTLSPLLLFLILLFPAQTDVKIITSIIGVFLTIITTLLRETFVKYKVTVSKQKVFAPEQFENIFDEIIKKITHKPKTNWEWITDILWKPRKKTKKLVLVIDNIDRCHKNLAFELLLTIKNFLEQKGVVFIIPIDEDEIKKHIREQGNNPNEFLRKLFNTTVTIKNNSEGDLFDFAKSLNDDYNLNFQIEIISIVAQQFSKNPRKIIQFLNVLQTEILLSEMQEKSDLIPKGSLTDNLAFISKKLVIREEWPELYSELKNNTHLLENTNNSIVEKEGIYYINNFKLNIEQRNFLRRTNHIKPNHNNFELFFINKDSYKDIPDKTNNLVQSNDLKGIKEQLKINELDFDKLIEFIDSKFETALKRGELKTTIVNLISLIFGLASDNSTRSLLDKYIYNSSKFLGGFRSFINSPKRKDILSLIDSKTTIEFIKKHPALSSNILQNLYEQINHNEDSQELIFDFIEAFKLDSKKLKGVSSKFSKYLANDQKFADKVKTLLTDKVVIENLIESTLINEYIDKIENNIENEDSNLKLELITLYDEIVGLSEAQTNNLVNKLIPFINAINDFTKTPFWLTKLKPFIASVKNTKTRTDLFSAINSKQTWLWQQYNSQSNKENYQNTLKILLEVITELYYITTDATYKDQLITWLNQYFSKNESQDLIVFTNNLFLNIISNFKTQNWPFAQHIINRFNQVTDWETKKEISNTLRLMLKNTNDETGLSEEQIEAIYTSYINLIDQDNEEVIIEWISESLENDYLTKDFEKVISKQNDNRKFELLRLLMKLNKNLLIENIITAILTNIECEKIDEVFDKIEIEKVSKDIIIKSIKTTLKVIDREDANFECLIESFSKSIFSDKVIQNLIAEKIKNMLARDEKEEVIFALKTMDNLEISDSRKLQAVKTLILDINESNFKEEELKLIKKMKSKYK
ncbi:P-loop NTPase fold protein [Muriicola sp. SD30]|uniref:KAP family P-loop NTPase fold protein n=1 Tax=Muriicola sp. SD30 TaxID=3240936 RepID=UPI00350F6F22